MSVFPLNLHIYCEIPHVSLCNRPTFGHDWIPWTVSFVEPEYKVAFQWVLGWDIETGKNVSRFREVPRRVRGAHDVTTMVPETRTKRVRNLTHSIVRTHAYPAAYGGFSDVWSCQLQCGRSPSKMVAVKAARPVATNEEYRVKSKVVEQELEIWGSLEHPNIVPLYGITYGFGDFPALVSPWADNGTLSEYLERSETQLDMKARMALLGDIAAGLWYCQLSALSLIPLNSLADVVHSHNIAHGDLGGANVLITGDGRARLSDFGLSTLIRQASDMSVSEFSFPGNIRWAAPELIGECGEGGSPSQLSSQMADIYSFGSIMLQTLTGKLPFHKIQRAAQIVIMIFRGDKPSREPGWDGRGIPDELWRFIEACWASPSLRPSSEKILGFIKDQISRL